jgi:hypothetical protein
VQKAKTALYEKGIPFESEMIDGFEPVVAMITDMITVTVH